MALDARIPTAGDFAESINGVALRVDSIDHTRGAMQLGAEIERNVQMDGYATYLTLRGTGESGPFCSDQIGVDLITAAGTICTALEALDEQRWSLALTGGMRPVTVPGCR